MIMFASSICTQIRIYVRGCTSTKTYSALRWNAVDWPMLHKFRCLKNDNIRTLFPANQGNRKPYCHEMCWCLDKYACAYINYNIYIYIYWHMNMYVQRLQLQYSLTVHLLYPKMLGLSSGKIKHSTGKFNL